MQQHSKLRNLVYLYQLLTKHNFKIYIGIGFKYCTVQQYKECLKTELGEARKKSDFCVCGTPCLEALYVSSLSFASITTTEDSIKSRQDAESYQMEANLAHAREMAFRHKEEKYKETMRVFHITETEVQFF